MRLLHRAIDFLQAQFPPNRLVVLLAGVTTALAGIISAWLAANFPGLDLGTTEIAIVLSAVLLIGFRLFDRWLDQWQRGEDIDAAADLELALDEIADDPAVQHALGELALSLGLAEDVNEKIALIRTRVGGGELDSAGVVDELGSLADTIAQFLHDHPAPSTRALPVAEPQP